jgi:peptide/nickel transport system substrate-binding protein
MAKKLSGRTWVLISAATAMVLALTLAALLRDPWRLGRPSGVRSGGPLTLVATVRSEPRSFNRFVARDRTSYLVSVLTQARLVRVNLETQEAEPALAERWTLSSNGLEYHLDLRRGVRFSDGAPFTSADVVFSFTALYDERVASPLAEAVKVDGAPLTVRAEGDHSVVLRLPAPFGPGLRILDVVPILPRHRLEGTLREGRFRDAWGPATNPADIAGLGPFVLQEYRQGERMLFVRNPHYWRKGPAGEALPLLDRLVLAVVPDQNAEVLRLESGQADLMSAEVRPDDLAGLRRTTGTGRLVLHDLGVGLDADFLWFNLTSSFSRTHPERAWLQRRELREAVSAAVDRRAFADTVYLGAAVPVYGPVTPGNRAWHDRSLPATPHDPVRARQLLGSVGLRDRDGDGRLESPDGLPARFSLLTTKGNSLRERAAQFLQEELRKIGLGVDVIVLELPAVIDRIVKGSYESAYFGAQVSDTDPASTLDFWLSSGAFHAWNPNQASPATSWEREIDELMHRQITTLSPGERRRLFGEVQRIFAEHLPAIYFAAPRVYVAMSSRVGNARPALVQPTVLWNADMLTVAETAGTR